MPTRAVPPALALMTGMVSGFVADRTGREPLASAEAVRIALRSAPFDSTKARRELGYAPRPIDGALTTALEALSRGKLKQPP